ncbi:MAG TPA: hypothetical protein VKQ71_00905 [Acidimicrobiales bacterium]|nr:hypothetical protein [Acidimicrobiales bacterium]
MRRLLISLFALTVSAVLVAACGGGGSAKTAVGTTVAATAKFSGSGSSSWCALDRSFQDSNNFANVTKDPKAWVKQVNDLLPKVEAAAPGPIKADVATLVTGVRTLVKAIVDDNYDFTKLTADQGAALQDPKFTAAGDRVTAYDKQVCGTSG